VATLKLHYEGWLALPPVFRQKLGLSTGAALEAKLVDGTIVLRPSSKGRGSAGREQGAIEPPVELASPAPAPRIDAPARQQRGRRRKTPEPGLLDQVSQPKQPRGRPRKTDRPVATATDNPVPAPERRPNQPMREAVYEYEREERRPFRHVEIRKLGPGRGHNRARTSHSWSRG
jgi:bifunctional DNA-binding transcriptional regulator/antitoxin component of YhaV-PrlF toxin-antitoxin module